MKSEQKKVVMQMLGAVEGIAKQAKGHVRTETNEAKLREDVSLLKEVIDQLHESLQQRAGAVAVLERVEEIRGRG